MAWTFMNTASNLCQTLRYHQPWSQRQGEDLLRGARESLFWTVHRLSKALSLRLGRPCGIQDYEITLERNTAESSAIKLAIIHGKVYDQLYGSLGLSRQSNERTKAADECVKELRAMIDETQLEILVSIIIRAWQLSAKL